jgi:carboxyl-terminal processing protease
MVKSFLRKGQMVVYTEGSHSPRRTYKASRDGRWVDWDLAVLIDESSASASEIFAGAIQDNDRGVTIGRRSFGKGLVQEEFGLPGSGALRLTVARFYTPTGRAIQKPYGFDVDYGDDYVERYDSGELFHRDSIPRPDSLRYETQGGRVVYGGGGITPDVFVPFDTSSYSNFLADVTWAGILRDAAFDFVDARRAELEGLQDWQSLPAATFEDAVEVLVAAADSAGFVVPDFAGWERDVIRQRMGAQVSRNLFGESAYHEVMLGQDRMVGEARVWLENPANQQVIAGELSLQTKQSQQNSTQNGI